MVDWSANYKTLKDIPSSKVCSCDDCKDEKMSRQSVWDESGSNGGTGYYSRYSVPYEVGTWSFHSWRETINPPKDRMSAIQRLKQWSALYKRDYATVQCSQCHAFHPTTGTKGWVGDTCDDCKPEQTKMKCTKCGAYTGSQYYLQATGGCFCVKCEATKVMATQVAETKKAPSVKGEVRKLPKANSPMWTDQWSVTGSAKEPYIVSHRLNGFNNSTTSEGWACACMAFTRNMPREDCKHILKVKLHEGIGLTSKQVVPASHAKEYAEFLKLKAKQDRAKTVDDAGAVKMVGDATGRKFR